MAVANHLIDYSQCGQCLISMRAETRSGHPVDPGQVLSESNESLVGLKEHWLADEIQADFEILKFSID